jgi:hypothetical protein
MFRYAFVTFRRAGEATQARHMLNGRHVCGHEVKVRKYLKVEAVFSFVQLAKSAEPYQFFIQKKLCIDYSIRSVPIVW